MRSTLGKVPIYQIVNSTNIDNETSHITIITMFIGALQLTVRVLIKSSNCLTFALEVGLRTTFRIQPY